MATAYAALVSLLNNLELIKNHPRHSFSFDDNQIESLQESVCFLIDFMESCDYHGGSIEAVEVLEKRIVYAAHAAEDVVESHVVDQIHAGSILREKTRCRFLLDLQKAIDGMDFVKRKAMKVKAQSGLKAEQPTYTYSSAAATSSTTLTYQKNSMVGFDDVLLRLLDVLTGEAASRQVIPIVGMGGIGKTTLARNAFEHKYIVQHFDVCLWVTISQQYTVEEILLQLLCYQRKPTGETVDEIGNQLHKKLWGRRYFIVLDDIWSLEVWDKIQLFLPDGNNSRIVLTTRQQNVADCFGPSCLKMDFLDDDESWILFCEKVFAKNGCPPELEEIGKEIVEKCKGLPLAIIVAGGHLGKSSKTQKYWENVAENLNSILDSREDEQCLDILSLSYSYLPAHLKPCFLYMGVFEEDRQISVSDLTKLWIAEGFLKPDEARSLEEVAEDYLKNLIDRNLILADRRTSNGETVTCEIHDLLRELCLKIAKKEKFFYVLKRDNDTPGAINRERRVVLDETILEENYDLSQIFHALRSAPLIRSLICEVGELSFDSRLLRVLNRVKSAITQEGLEANFQQVNLRYLRCSDGLDYEWYRSFCLPSSISMLWNLQAIIIEGIYIKIIAPSEIWELPQLRHLVSYLICLPDPLPPSDRFDDYLVLRNVQTLSRVANFRLSEEICQRIPNIKELRVAYYNFVSECDEPMSHYCPHNLGRLSKLESLGCSFSEEPEWRDFALGLTFPNSLRELYFMNLCLEWEELTMMMGLGSLPHLEVLYLSQLKGGAEWNCVDGGYPRLKSLSIYHCSDLIYWNAESSYFPVLEYIFLGNLSKLDEFPSGIGEIPTLQQIELRSCSVALAISAMKMVVEQEDHGNESLQLGVTFGHDKENLESFMREMQEQGLRSKNLSLYSISIP